MDIRHSAQLNAAWSDVVAFKKLLNPPASVSMLVWRHAVGNQNEPYWILQLNFGGRYTIEIAHNLTCTHYNITNVFTGVFDRVWEETIPDTLIIVELRSILDRWH